MNTDRKLAVDLALALLGECATVVHSEGLSVKSGTRRALMDAVKAGLISKNDVNDVIDLIDENDGAWLPKKGDKVRLNAKGFKVLGGPLTKEEMQAAVGVLTIRWVGSEVTPGQWEIDVDGPLNKFMLSSLCVERA